MDFSRLFFLNLEIVIILMIGLWLLSLVLRNSGIVDIFWGSGFIIINLIAFYFSQHTWRHILLTVLVTLWGLRLSIHIYLRSKGKPEDFRYAQWRKENGSHWWWISFFKVFLLQGVLLSIIAAPLLAVQSATNNSSPAGLDYLGIIIWIVGFIFEAGGDYQLSRFKANPSNKGKVLTRGLWRYTRHPNYFGDAVQWWGFFILAGSSGNWWTVFSPLVMTILLIRVSGVALLEKTMKSRPGYDEYRYSTNAFFPWPPKSYQKQV
jgi:steroid 5-alpha reductase family enzyme